MLRVVLDTNILVSGILSRKGAPAQALDAWRERRYLLVTSPSLIAEIRLVLHYPRIRDRYALTDEDIDQIIALLEHEALLVSGETKLNGAIPSDPQDEIVLACAIEGQVDMIVSGDHHLLGLGTYDTIQILTAGQFIEKI